MRILHLGDTHLGAHFVAWGAPAGWHRSQDHLEAFRAALRPATEGRVDLVVHAGDLFDKRVPSPQGVQDAWDLLSSLARHTPVVVMPGNHDPGSLRRLLRSPPPSSTWWTTPRASWWGIWPWA